MKIFFIQTINKKALIHYGLRMWCIKKTFLLSIHTPRIQFTGFSMTVLKTVIVERCKIKLTNFKVCTRNVKSAYLIALAKCLDLLKQMVENF